MHVCKKKSNFAADLALFLWLGKKRQAEYHRIMSAKRVVSSPKKSWVSSLKFIVIQFVLAAVMVVLLLVGLRLWLNHQTAHGIEVEVPQITGLDLIEAQMLLQGADLRLQVIDSTYSKKVPLGTIVEQVPVAESMAKRGRVVYVVVNARQRKQIILPELSDVSYRQAENILRQQGLHVDSVEYEPSAYRDLVLDVRRNEESLPAGTRLTEGDGVILVVGMGLGEGKAAVPDLKGLTLQEARSLLLANRLTIGTIDYDDPEAEDKSSFVVYQQQPHEGERLQEGQSVNIRLSADLEKAATTDNELSEEDFF